MLLQFNIYINIWVVLFLPQLYIDFWYSPVSISVSHTSQTTLAEISVFNLSLYAVYDAICISHYLFHSHSPIQSKYSMRVVRIKLKKKNFWSFNLKFRFCFHFVLLSTQLWLSVNPDSSLESASPTL